MTELKYDQANAFISKLNLKEIPPALLLFGDEYLYKKVFRDLLDKIMPESERSLGFEQVDPDGSIFDAVEMLNTYSFLGGMKIIYLKDSRIFFSKKNEDLLLDKAEQATLKNELKKASGFILNLLSINNMGVDDLSKENRKSTKLKFDESKDYTWLDTLTAYCLEHGLSVPEKKDDIAVLAGALEKGFPEGTHLIITSGTVDKRKSLFKLIKKNGIIVDCSVPKGERAADKKIQEGVLVSHMNEILKKNGISMDRSAFQALLNMTGFDLRVFSGNLEKLVDYSKERGKITTHDVQAVLKRTKLDPIFELTGSLSGRNLAGALFYMESLISSGIHPLQVLAALVNQIRKLILAIDFLESGAGKAWKQGCQFNYFKTSVLPAMARYEKKNLETLSSWVKELKPEGTGKKAAVKTDLKIVPNPQNPYPIYLSLQKAGNYSKKELISAFRLLHQADFLLKSSGGDPKMILEKTVIDIMARN